MSLGSRKSGTTFQKPRNVGKHGTLTPREWAELMLLAGFPKNVQVIAEGLGVLENESGFNSDPGGDGAHFGAWQEDSGFGSETDRLDPFKSTKAAYEAWKVTKSFHDKWGQWEAAQSGTDGATTWKQHKKAAEEAIVAVGSGLATGHILNEGGPVGLAEDAAGAISSAEDFLTEVFNTLTDFKRLGQLAAEGFSWFLRLLAKALWDYVAAPVWHWSERAVGWYWANFFGVGTERNSGGGKLGPILRQNAGVITIVFWSVGYAVLWSDGESISPAPAQSSMLGRGVRAFDGTLARRNLIKPKDVKSKTPKKPKPKATSVTIDRTGEFSVKRKRPVSVGGSDGQPLEREGTSNERGNNRQSHRIPRPGTTPQPKGTAGGAQNGLILPEGVERPAQTEPQSEAKKAPSQSGAGVAARSDSGSGAKSPASGGGKKGS